METKDIALLAVTLIILAEVSYLLAKLPKASLKTKGRAILVDTSVLMDGRIVNVAATGFIGGTLVIPRSVVGELQLLADGSDSDKRARARHGLDVVSSLQKLEYVDVEILQDGSRADEGVDERLLTLAKRHHALICTLDFNLNKVAVVEGINVLNINELAQSLRMNHLPGDQILIEVVQKGQDTHQGVGYLADGTMVVIEQASAYIGKSITVEVIRSLQTAAGKMMFAKRVDDKKQSASSTQHRSARHDSPKPVQEVVARKATGRKVFRKPAVNEPAKTESVYHAQPVQPRQSQPVKQRPVQRPVAKPDQRSSAQPRHSQVSTSRPVRRSNRRTDHEAELLALVDKQE
jgi:rRNA-processing protein FCF1